MYHSKAWLVDDYRDPALETNVTTTVTGAATWDPLFEPDPKIRKAHPFQAHRKFSAFSDTKNFSHHRYEVFPALLGSVVIFHPSRGKKIRAYAMNRGVAGVHPPTPRLFEQAKRPDNGAEYCLGCCLILQ